MEHKLHNLYPIQVDMLGLGFQDIRSTVHPGRLRKSRQLTGSNALRNRVLWFRWVKKTWERNLKEFSITKYWTTKILDHLGWYLMVFEYICFPSKFWS